MTFDGLYSSFSLRSAHDNLNGQVPFNLRREMRRTGVTIAELANRLGVTQKRVREVRGMTRVSYLVALDYLEALEKGGAR